MRYDHAAHTFFFGDLHCGYRHLLALMNEP